MQYDHHKMSQHEKENCPDARVMKSSHHPGKPGELNRLPDGEASEYGENAKNDRGGIGLLLQWVIYLAGRRFGTEQEIMLHHRPNAGNVARRKQHLAVIAAKNLIPKIQGACAHVNPHKGQMPLQRTTQPTTNGKRPGPMQEIPLRNLRAEAGKSAENLQAASNHHKQSHGIEPVAEANDVGVLVDRATRSDGLGILVSGGANDFNYGAHTKTSSGHRVREPGFGLQARLAPMTLKLPGVQPDAGKTW